MVALDEDAVELEGYLLKAPRTKKSSSCNKRYFVLTKTSLTYYKDEKARGKLQPRGHWAITSSVRVEVHIILLCENEMLHG